MSEGLSVQEIRNVLDAGHDEDEEFGALDGALDLVALVFGVKVAESGEVAVPERDEARAVLMTWLDWVLGGGAPRDGHISQESVERVVRFLGYCRAGVNVWVKGGELMFEAGGPCEVVAFDGPVPGISD